MKKYFSIILLLFLTGCNYKFIDKPGLKGKVKKYTEYKIFVDKEGKKDTFSKMINTYNRNGLLT